MRGIPWNEDWRFTLEEPEAPHLLHTDDSTWRTVRLPHDWSVKFPFDPELEACTGYLPGGTGWYRKRFITSPEMTEQKVFLNFDGIYNRASIYCNGSLVRFHPSGYSPCLIEITDQLHGVDEENVIAVKVDRTRYADSRWYTGSGIYRKVALHLLPKLHIPVWGTYHTTPRLDDEKGTLLSRIQLNNDSGELKMPEMSVTVYRPDGQLAATQSRVTAIPSGERLELKFELEIFQPQRWEIHEARLYKVVTVIIDDGKVLQEVEEPFGFRDFRFDADKGFFFNGRSMKIKGVNLHHDGGLVGAAVPLDVWRRRLQKLKACGCNAIRTAHNPASEDFLDLCDEMGFLVQEEFFDEWDYPKDKRYNGNEQSVDDITQGHAEFFREYAQADLQDTMRRDRNHPCIFQWSIGNEIEWTYPKYNAATGYFGMNASGNYFWTLPPNSKETISELISRMPRDRYDIDTTAGMLVRWTKELDATRPVTANCILPSASYESGYIDQLDLAGYSYRRVIYDYGKRHYPDKPIMGTENVAQWHEWKAVLEREHVAGIFLWTGIDHMGEARRKPFPLKGSEAGLLDLAGFDKPSYHMFKSLWNEEPHLYIATQTLEKSLYQMSASGELVERIEGGWQERVWFWHDVFAHWNYCDEEQVVVEMYSNCEEISLYHNDRLVSVQRLRDFEDHIYKWVLPFAAGELKAVGRCGDQEIVERLRTVGPVHRIQIEVDQEQVKVDADSVVHVTANLLDANGTIIRNQNLCLHFQVEGEARILGVDNGSADNVQPFQSTRLVTDQGRGLMIVQGLRPGTLMVRASCADHHLVSNTCIVKVNA
ncbi:glycoside hydrolase family 2 TIM barrel-domain containing protein [Paenibacillus sp. JSM ZJ436]|uniref:glycoside hydrolase family 2 TIM barrel-domain containing protein n=1 Tax=Paenibacillus sp. JSM ZJ436 TaxID=3376190 RepID=UPI00378F5BB6